MSEKLVSVPLRSRHHVLGAIHFSTLRKQVSSDGVLNLEDHLNSESARKGSKLAETIMSCKPDPVSNNEEKNHQPVTNELVLLEHYRIEISPRLEDRTEDAVMVRLVALAPQEALGDLYVQRPCTQSGHKSRSRWTPVRDFEKFCQYFNAGSLARRNLRF